METPSTMRRDELARRRLTLPNIISFARLTSVPVFLWLFSNDREEAGLIVYGVGAFTDFLDGYVARRTHSVTNLGKILDPLADRIFIVALCLVLLARGSLPAWLAAVVVVRDVAIVSLLPVLERRGVPRIPVNLTGKAATALLLFGLSWLALSETSFGWATMGRTIGLPSAAAGAVLYWVAAVQYGREAVIRLRHLEIEEPLP